MARQLTPKRMYRYFTKTYPKLSSHVVHWHPKNVLELVLYLDDGSKMLYNYDDGRAVILEDRWKQ